MPRAPITRALAAFVVLAALTASTATASAAVSQSANIAFVETTSQGHGGSYPTTGFPNSYAPATATVSLTSIRDDAADPLTPYDTVVLVGVCDIGNWLSNSQFAGRLASFVSGGGKLIIEDSECSQTDYSNLFYSFTTNNPGAAGAQGTLTIVENSMLGSSDPASPYYIDAGLISTDTDAVGDANVFTSYDPNFCVAEKATNVNGVNGPVLAYAPYGSGLLIYNGLDRDALSSSSPFDTSSGESNLARQWLFELLVPSDGAGLPCGVKVFGLTLDPKTATNQIGTSHTVAATVFVNGSPKEGAEVAFSVAGPNAGATGTVTTDANGKAAWSYIGANPGTDTITATVSLAAGETTKTVSETATKVWTAPPVALTETPAAETPPVAAPQQLVLPTRILPGSARLYSKTACVTRSFRARVAGRSIAQVTFRLDGKLIRVVKRLTAKTRYIATIHVPGLKDGPHRLVATVRFVSGSGTKAKELSSSFRVCRQVRAPAFTG